MSGVMDRATDSVPGTAPTTVRLVDDETNSSDLAAPGTPVTVREEMLAPPDRHHATTRTGDG